MKYYNIQNYIRYKTDLEKTIARIKIKEHYSLYDRNKLVVLFMPLVENIARKFATSQQASGVMSILDLIQEGNLNLIKAVDRIDWDKMAESEDQEKTMKSFLSKRIKGGIRRAIDIQRGTMRIPEHKINEIRKNEGKDRDAVEMFFNSVFQSLDAMVDDTSNMYDVPEPVQTYNPELLASYLIGLLQIHLEPREFDVIVYSYGINCDKLSAKQIAAKLDIKGDSAYVRVSQLKRQAIDKLIDNVDYSQVVDFL